MNIKLLKSALLPLAAMAAIFAFSPVANAQATRTWVSGVGDDVNPCSRTAPCKTFPGAISKTAVNGEINCLDPAGFGSVTITKSITIDCTGTLGGILSANTFGVQIAFDSFAAGDTRRTVKLRGLDINGANTGTFGVRILGGANSVGSTVYVEDSVIDGIFAAGANVGRGISDERTQGGELFVSRSTIRNVVLFGVSVAGPVSVVIEDSRVQNSTGHGASLAGASKTQINRSVFSGHTEVGVFAFGSAQANINNTVVTHNGTGLQTSAGTIMISNSDISFNATGISGATTSFGNNRIQANTNAGNAPTVIGGQ